MRDWPNSVDEVWAVQRDLATRPETLEQSHVESWLQLGEVVAAHSPL